MTLSNTISTSTLLTAAVVGTLSIASIADAATISYTQNYPGPFPSAAKTTTDWDGATQTISLTKFDTNLGTLTSATISLYGEIDTSGTI